MALSYVQEDLSRYIDLHDLTGIPFNFQLVIFPYRGHQPPPFPAVEDSTSDDPEPKEGSLLTVHRSAFPFSELGSTEDYTNEIRWWFHPLIFAGEIPIRRRILKIVKSRPLNINPLCARNPDFQLIKKVNPNVISELHKTRVINDTIKSWGNLAAGERNRIFADVRLIAREFKKAYPENFGESGDDSSQGSFRAGDGEAGGADGGEGEREKKEGKFIKRLKKISPTIARKLTRKNENDQ